MVLKLKLILKMWYDALKICGVIRLPKFIINYIVLKKDINKRIEPLKKFSVENPGQSYQKYLNVDYWVFETLLRCYVLGIDKSKKKMKILDIGTGNGYFPFICNYLGHYTESIDIGAIELYDLSIAALEVKRYKETIVAFKQLDINNKYDLITAFMICFNGHNSDSLWHIEEWKFFINSLGKNNLIDSGKIFLSLNQETNGNETINKSLFKYFGDNGALVEKNTVSINFKNIFN
jgi:SAM-dependent methyltransferase